MHIYQLAAAIKAWKLIESSTRFTPDDVAVIGEECFECNFKVKVDCVINSNAASQTGAGNFKLGYRIASCDQ